MRAAAARTICSCSELSSRYGTARSSGRSSQSPQPIDEGEQDPGAEPGRRSGLGRRWVRSRRDRSGSRRLLLDHGHGAP